ncbi:MAG TPA: hypothetical protein VLC79_05025 [Cellvibrio sp.]|nr:hypothetical protein [Cellvibrio sp.]
MNIDRFSPLLQRTTLLLSLIGGMSLLTACGGGSDDKSSASSAAVSSSSLRSSYAAASVPANGSGTWPSVKVEAQNPKVLTFQWTAVEGATYYKLYKHDAATGGVVQVGGDLTTTQATDEIGVHVHDWVNNYYYVEACDAAACQKSNLTFTATEMIKAIGYIKASNADAADLFGWSIAVSADGTTLAVGAPAEDSKAKGANGDQANNESSNSGAVYIFVKQNGVWVQQAYLKASNTEQPDSNPYLQRVNDRFGYQVALSDDGNTLAVSAILEDSPSYGINCNQDNHQVTSATGTEHSLMARDYNVGAVYIFNRAQAEWSQAAYVKPVNSLVYLDPRTTADDLRFGETIALAGDGKTLAVGTTVELTGTYGVINAANTSSDSNSSGNVCVEFYPSSASADSSSSSSSSSSSIVDSSSSTNSFTGGVASGAVYLFHLTENGWDEEAVVKGSNAQVGDLFGTAVALSTDGNTMVVGAIGEDGSGTGSTGDQVNNGCYYYSGNLVTYDGSALTVDAACTTAAKVYFAGNLDNGAAYVFTRANQLWAQEAYLKPSTPFWATRFGTSVDISGDGTTITVGAPGDASKSTTVNGDQSQSLEFANTGAAYIFKKAGAAWSQEAFIKPSTLTKNTAINLIPSQTGGHGSIQISGGGEFGGDVSLSQDGNTLAVGSFREPSSAIGINLDQGDTSAPRAGAVFVFTRDNTAWNQKSYVKASNTDSDDRFGLAVDLSGDGKTMAVNAPRESGRGYATSSGASSSVSSPDPADDSAEAAGAVYLF